MPPLLPLAGKAAAAIGFRSFVMIGLGLALAIAMWRADRISADRDNLRTALATERAAHAITRASVSSLEKTVADLNAQARARADAFARSRAEARREAEALERAARRSDAQIASLRALAANGGQCEVPSELADALEGL